MKKVKGFINNHLVIMWVICSIVYAIIVNVCFSVKIPISWLKVKWNAGDILTYTSTVSLGLLALWQNRKLAKENKESQEQLKEIIKHSNELSVVQRIIEIQSQRIDRIRKSIDEYSKLCSVQSLEFAIDKAGGLRGNVIANMRELERDLSISYDRLNRELKLDRRIEKDSGNSISKTLERYYSTMLITIKNNQGTPLRDNESEKEVLEKLKEEFEKVKEKYIYDQEEKLNSIIYDNLTIAEIKKLYG